jgi:hypothetical protein
MRKYAQMGRGPRRGPLSRLQGATPTRAARRGRLQGPPPPWGGRAPGRAPWYRSTLVAVRYHPVRTRLYARWRMAGTAAPGALMAGMRQCVTLLTPWSSPRSRGTCRRCRAQNIQGSLDNQDSGYAPASLRLPAAAEAQR